MPPRSENSPKPTPVASDLAAVDAMTDADIRYDEDDPYLTAAELDGLPSFSATGLAEHTAKLEQMAKALKG